MEERIERELSSCLFSRTSTVALEVDGDFDFFFFFLEEEDFRAGSVDKFE